MEAAVANVEALTADEAGMMNGFRSLPEPTSIEVDPQNIAPFTMPQEALTFFPDANAQVSRFRNGDKERKIHCNIELEPTEIEELQLLQREAEEAKAAFMPALSVAATRYLSHARGDHKKALKMMEATQEWRQSYFGEGPLRDTDLLEDLRLGLVYFTGRDKALRPILVFRASRIPAAWHRERRFDKLIKVLVFSMEYCLRYMTVPGRIESINVLVDLRDLSISQIPLGALREVHKNMGTHFVGRVFRFYIVNMPRVLSAIAPVAKKILSDRQQQKLVFVTRTQELQREMALWQIEEDLGGTRPAIEEFFPFPLLPGPFGPETRGPELTQAVSNAHAAFAPEGWRGRLWDPSKTRWENCRQLYSDEAPEIFKRCGLQVPSHFGEPPTAMAAEKDGALPSCHPSDEESPGCHRGTHVEGERRDAYADYGDQIYIDDQEEEPTTCSLLWSCKEICCAPT